MRKFLLRNNLIIILIFFILWRLFLFIPLVLSQNIGIIHNAYIAQIPLANFDGIHYLSIAKSGYQQYEQAFFPMFPLLINIIANIFRISYLNSGIILSHLFTVFSIFYLYKLLRIDFNKKIVLFSILFFLFFPTSFFLVNVYTESLFLFLLFSSFYYARKNKFLLSSIFGAIACATRVVGIFIFPAILYEAYVFYKSLNKNSSKLKKLSLLYTLIIPSGLLSYMYYLYIKYNDALFFVHSQAEFTGRTGGKIILLPQVIWRYIKIFATVSISNYDYWISFLEMLFFILSLIVLYLSFKKGFRKSYLIFSSLAILFPTLSGTLLSMPRFVLVSFVIYIYFASINNKIVKYAILFIGMILEILLSALFYRGYFIA